MHAAQSATNSNCETRTARDAGRRKSKNKKSRRTIIKLSSKEASTIPIADPVNNPSRKTKTKTKNHAELTLFCSKAASIPITVSLNNPIITKLI